MYRQNAYRPEMPRKRKIELAVVIGLGVQIALGLAIILSPHFLGCSRSGVLSAFSDDWPNWPPTIRDLNGDGVDDLVGEHSGGALAVDGKTGRELWKKTWSSYGDVRVVGDFVARLQGRDVELVDIRTGKVARIVTPPWQDKPARLEVCGPAIHATAIDESSTRIDPATGAMTSGAPSASCRAEATRTHEKSPPCRHPHAVCEAAPAEFGRDARVLRDPTTGQSVRLTFKSKGTPVATATPLSPADGTGLVVAPEGNLDAIDLASGWLVVVRGRELVAHELATKRSWTMALTTGVQSNSYDFGWLRIEKDRVYVDTSPERRGARGELLVLDLATGTRLWK